jgi:addiction module RelE/StbE family toxin
MRELILTTYFAKRFSKIIGKNPRLLARVQAVLDALQENPFAPALETHKLKGKLENYFACTVAYDLRIVFRFEGREPPEVDAVVLLNIGTHDEVY